MMSARIHFNYTKSPFFFCLLVVAFSVTSFAACDKSKAASNPEALETTSQGNELNPEPSDDNAQKNEDPKPLEQDSHPDFDGDFHSIYSFLDNRPLAHEIDHDTVVAQVKDEGFKRYFWGNHARQWKENIDIDGQRVIALDKRRDGSLSIPSPVPNPNGLLMRVYNPVDNAKNILKVKLNGKPLEDKNLEKGWNILAWKLNGEGKLENNLDLEFTGLGRIDGSLSGGALTDFEIGNFDYDAVVKAIQSNEDNKLPAKGFGLSNSQGAFPLSENQGAMWYFFNVPKTSLRISIKGNKGCGVKLKVEDDDNHQTKPLIDKELKLNAETLSAAFEIQATPENVSRLTLRPLDNCKSVSIDSLDLVTKGHAPARKTFDPPKHILIWMIDTLRSDHLPIHFDTDVQAPNLQKLANEGASFKWGIVQGNESKTSHASFFTGMYPDRHRVLARGTLKPHHELIPEALQKAGYKTAAYMANGYISQPWGFVQGWDFYRNNLREQLGITAAALRKDTEGWMSKNLDQKFMMYVGTIDPHVSYRAHEGIIEKYADPNYKGPYKDSCSGETLGKIKANPDKVSEADRKQIQALYKNEIEYNDQEFGKLRAFMEENGLWENTLVVITADHGDEFWEHGSVGHGHSVYDELVHVPIIFYYPPAIDAGVKPTTGADVLDIFPTLVDIAGAKPVDDVQGESLLPYMQKNAVVYPAPGIATRYLSHYAFQVGPWSYLLRRGDFDLFDNQNDIHEQTNVAAQHPFETRALTDAASWFLAAPKEWEKTTWGNPTNLAPNFLNLYRKTKK